MRGAEVRRIRKRHGLRQVDFAKLVGVHPITVSRWETDGVKTRAMERLLRLLAAQRPSSGAKK